MLEACTNFLKFWDFQKLGTESQNFRIGYQSRFFISEVDAELPFALRKISFQRVGVRSSVA
jgi:hypothetical protein